ncbi:MAG: hypothetical protein WDN24_01480 [Sphingomonas sp.]
MMQPWLFNIVYTPGTVGYLLPFAHSLLQHSDARFRLVDNGCLPAERRLIEALVRRHDRLLSWTVPGAGCRPHGEVLDMLRTLPAPGPFCFLDSDIVASGPFLDPLRDSLASAPAVFSGAPLWLTEGDGVFRAGMRSLTGEYLWDAQGRSLGVTYVAAYDPARLAEATTRHGVGFGEYRWDALPAPVRDVLDRRGRRAEIYDTGKAINGLLDGEGVHVPLPNLHHIGGFSFPARDGALVAGAARRMPLPPFVHRLLAAWSYRRFGGREEAALLRRRRIGLRDPVRRYFWTLVHALARGDFPARATPDRRGRRRPARPRGDPGDLRLLCRVPRGRTASPARHRAWLRHSNIAPTACASGPKWRSRRYMPHPKGPPT